MGIVGGVSPNAYRQWSGTRTRGTQDCARAHLRMRYHYGYLLFSYHVCREERRTIAKRRGSARGSRALKGRSERVGRILAGVL